MAQAKPLLGKLTNADTGTSQREEVGKKEILGHLMDSPTNNHQRFVRATLQGSLTFPGYDREPLVDLQQFREVDWGFLVDLWAAYNRYCPVLSVLPADAGEIVCNIGNNPTASLAFIAEDYVAHLKHHLNQILGKTFETSYGATAR